ncbi:hypothetical protein TIFTF001_037211 [Ficus carica]|uniref:Uncharacterized protein n=1 Tax=Ficus carica TaxID=3494 RepID=A0AA88E5N5_FICCA|nr:hypothetical protein TIFTF001_037211 [Ficus carica]
MVKTSSNLAEGCCKALVGVYWERLEPRTSEGFPSQHYGALFRIQRMPAPYQPEAVGDNDTRIDPEEENPTKYGSFRLNARVIYISMVRPRAAAERRPQEANLAEMIVNLQCRLEDQECKMQNLREQLAQENQELPPPPVVQTPPVAPTVPMA